MEKQGALLKMGVRYRGVVRFLNAGQHLVLLVVRLYFGFVCMQAGYRHLTNFHSTVDAFIGWKVPMPTVSAAVSGVTELVGGAMLMVGLFSRLISIPLVINFFVAILVANLGNPDFHDKILHFWNYPDVVLKDDAFPLFCTAVLVLCFGPGMFSLDVLVRAFVYRWRGKRPGVPGVPVAAR